MDTPREFIINKAERQVFALGQGWRTCLRAYVQTVYTLLIKTRAHENFEEQNKIPANSIIITNYCISSNTYNNNNNNNVKTKMIPVIIGATGTISKTFRKYVSNISGNHEVKELQKTAILGTAHILRKVLM